MFNLAIICISIDSQYKNIDNSNIEKINFDNQTVLNINVAIEFIENTAKGTITCYPKLVLAAQVDYYEIATYDEFGQNMGMQVWLSY